MKIVILSILVLLIVLLYFLYPLFKAVQVSKDIEKHTVAYEQHPNNPTIRIMVAGDSTGVGTGSSDPKESIAGRIGHDFPTADILNISENGITIGELKKKLNSQRSADYDLILIQIGANDVTGLTSYKGITTTLREVLDYTGAHASSTIVMTAGDIGSAPTFKYPLSAYITHRTLFVRALFLKEIESRNSTYYIDLYRDKEHNVFNTDIGKYYARDHFHPSSSGYAEWYASLGPVVREVLGRRS